MRRFKILLMFSWLLYSSILSAQVPDGYTSLEGEDKIKNGIRETSYNTQSIAADFLQEKHLTMMEEIIISKGKFQFKKENNVRWEYTEPIVYAIIIRDEHFIINNDGKISEYNTESNRLFKEINNMIVMAIQGNFVDDPEFQVTFFENEKNILASLIPENDLLENILSTIEIYFDKKDLSVVSVKFIEPGDDFTFITFVNRQMNIEIPDEQFTAQ
jgi:outer membrane lipoprotein-sorting protein